MPYLLERHQVRDYARWREVFDADAEGRKDAGCRAARIFQNADDPQEVVVLFEWDSLERARRRIESATLEREFEEAGVSGGTGQTEFYLLEEAGFWEADFARGRSSGNQIATLLSCSAPASRKEYSPCERPCYLWSPRH